jgi:hypothetical protein
MDNITRDENDPVDRPAQQIASLFEKSLIAALVKMKAAGLDHTADHLYVAVMGVSTSINIAAKLMTMPNIEEGDDEDEVANKWASRPACRTAILAACLLVARCSKPGEDGIEFEFGPRHILAAIEAAEKITGQNNDAIYAPGMLKAAKNQEPPAHFFDNSTVDLSQYRTLN